jgi:hypothetical protein
MVENGTRYRPITPVTQSLLLLYMFLTATLDFFVFAALHSHRLGLLASTATATDFMSKFVPAIDGMSDFLQGRGYASFIIPYRALISMNWMLFLIFVPAMTVSLASEIRKSEDKFLSWIESGYRVSLNRRKPYSTGLFDDLVRKAFSDPLGKTRIFIAFIFGGLLIMLCSDFVVSSSAALYFPGYFLLGVWCCWVLLLATGMLLAQFSLIAFYKKRATDRSNS